MAGGPLFARLASGLFDENLRDSGTAHNQHLSQQATDEAHSEHDDGSGADAVEQERDPLAYTRNSCTAQSWSSSFVI